MQGYSVRRGIGVAQGGMAGWMGSPHREENQTNLGGLRGRGAPPRWFVWFPLYRAASKPSILRYLPPFCLTNPFACSPLATSPKLPRGMPAACCHSP
jgi:hypothetical protein